MLILALDGGLATTGAAAILINEGQPPIILNVAAREDDKVPGEKDSVATKRRIAGIQHFLNDLYARWLVPTHYSKVVLEDQLAIGASMGTVKSAIGFGAICALIPTTPGYDTVSPASTRHILGIKGDMTQSVRKRLVRSFVKSVGMSGVAHRTLDGMTAALSQHALDACVVGLAWTVREKLWLPAVRE